MSKFFFSVCNLFEKAEEEKKRKSGHVRKKSDRAKKNYKKNKCSSDNVLVKREMNRLLLKIPRKIYTKNSMNFCVVDKAPTIL